MKFCPKCDEICSDKSNFCSNCGYSFGEIAPKEEQTALTKEEPEAAIAPVMTEEKQAPEAGISEEKEEKVPELTLTPEERKRVLFSLFEYMMKRRLLIRVLSISMMNIRERLIMILLRPMQLILAGIKYS